MSSKADAAHGVATSLPPLLDRDLSILGFNERVLDWARRPRVPLLERMRYLCIVSSNLDEFFEVRMAPHIESARTALETAGLERIVQRAHAMVDEQYRLYNQVLLPALRRQGIRLLSHGERDARQRRWVQAYFNREVKPLLLPVSIDPAHPLPQVANKSLNFIVHLQGKDAFGRENEIAIVKVPRSLPRVIALPRERGSQDLAQQDVLIHQPFESFEGVIDFLREAVRDPAVLAIKQTIYRTGSDPVMIDLLREAVRRGKEVTAVVELKARFDEEANINWAEQLEAIGVQVVYGVVGLKTHAKMLLVTRREGRRLRRYGHLSTGNYNPRSARLYTDLSFLTADARITADMDELFTHLASQNPLRRLHKLLVAPFHLHARMLQWIGQTAEAARRGQAGRIILKMNALTDRALIEALMLAGQAGVEIDLIVRGACLLPAGIGGQTERIRVRSVIGRFLEHSRVSYFRAGEQEALYLSSADWMNRNMMRRIEVAWPVEDAALRQRVIDECLTAYLHDQRDAWCMTPDARYEPVQARGRRLGAQQALADRYMLQGPQGKA